MYEVLSVIHFRNKSLDLLAILLNHEGHSSVYKSIGKVCLATNQEVVITLFTLMT